jgi:hypothetical protein
VLIFEALDARGWPSGWASAFQADLHGFDSRTPLQAFAILSAGVAQLVEHLICNQRVGGSSPSAGSKIQIRAVWNPSLAVVNDDGFVLDWVLL